MVLCGWCFSACCGNGAALSPLWPLSVDLPTTAAVTSQTMMFNQPAVLHALLEHLTVALTRYAIYQIDAGAQVVQLFDSWAHHPSPEQFAEVTIP